MKVYRNFLIKIFEKFYKRMKSRETFYEILKNFDGNMKKC